jgi:hypothetical protein
MGRNRHDEQSADEHAGGTDRPKCSSRIEIEVTHEPALLPACFAVKQMPLAGPTSRTAPEK